MTFSDETIQEIVGIFETNSIEIRLQQSEINGLYEIGSMMEHSCCPNVRMSFDDKFNVSLYTIYIYYPIQDFFRLVISRWRDVYSFWGI